MRQVYVGSDHHVKVGSFPMRGELDSDDTGNVLGFRVVFDNSMRRVAGSSSHYPPRVARRSGTDNLHPEEVNQVVGIRLVADWDSR